MTGVVRPDEEVTIVRSGRIETMRRADAVVRYTDEETASPPSARRGVQRILRDLYIGRIYCSDI